jgi:hypothetical protein
MLESSLEAAGALRFCPFGVLANSVVLLVRSLAARKLNFSVSEVNFDSRISEFYIMELSP